MIPAISTLTAGIGWLTKNWLGVLSTAIGVSGLVHSIVNSRSIKRQTLEQRRAVSAVELRQWTDEVTNALSAAVHLDTAASNTSEQRKQVLTRLWPSLNGADFGFQTTRVDMDKKKQRLTANIEEESSIGWYSHIKFVS